MSILNITNITDTPEQFIRDKFNSVFEEFGQEISEEKKNAFIDEQIESLEELAELTLGKYLQALIDNYLINNDYYDDVENFFMSIEDEEEEI